MLLAGYITATTVDLVRVKRIKSEIRLLKRTSFVNQDYSNFESILKIYLKNNKDEIDLACFGVAGPVISDEIKATNILWNISARSIEKQFSILKVQLVNDLVATAYGLFHLSPDKLITINDGSAAKEGQIGLLAAGDGLGQSLIYREGDKLFPYASEGGHADFAPASQVESDLWEFLYAEKGQVEVEDVLSLTGLDNIYKFLLHRSNGNRPAWYEKTEPHERPSQILEQALAGKDELAGETLGIFTDCLASEAANLALRGMTLGGVYLGGLIGKQIMTSLDKGRFMDRFVKKGKMESVLKEIPVSLIIDEKTALLGAAVISLERSGL